MIVPSHSHGLVDMEGLPKQSRLCGSATALQMLKGVYLILSSGQLTYPEIFLVTPVRRMILGYSSKHISGYVFITGQQRQKGTKQFIKSWTIIGMCAST